MKRQIGGLLALAFLVACTSALAEEIPSAEKITNFSPDKKFAVRIAYDPSLLPENGEEIPPDATRKLELIAMPSEELVLDFSEEEGGLQGKVLWSQDSKWFAYRVLEQFLIFRGGAGDAKIQFTVRFDEHGKFKVVSKKKVREKD